MALSYMTSASVGWGHFRDVSPKPGARPFSSADNNPNPHNNPKGSLIDIVNPGTRLKPNHSWHLDANLPQATVMLGFPRANHYSGAGVFSHAVQLSHQLRDHVPGGKSVSFPA